MNEQPVLLDASSTDGNLDATSADGAADAIATVDPTIQAAHALELHAVDVPPPASREKQAVTFVSMRASTNAIPGRVITRIVSQNFGRVRLCVSTAAQPIHTADVTTFFAIRSTGDVAFAEADPSLANVALAQCIQHVLAALSYPPPDPPLLAVEVKLHLDADAIPPQHHYM